MLTTTLLRRTVLATVAALSLATVPAAQGTSGIAGFNDYTVGGLTPASSSCTVLSPFPAGPTVFMLNTQPNAPAVFFFNINCPCRACLLPWFPAFVCPVPALPCMPTTNSAFELDTSSGGCGFVSAPVTADPAGIATLTVVLPPTSRFSTQALALVPCAGPGLVWSQAYTVSVP